MAICRSRRTWAKTLLCDRWCVGAANARVRKAKGA